MASRRNENRRCRDAASARLARIIDVYLCIEVSSYLETARRAPVSDMACIFICAHSKFGIASRLSVAELMARKISRLKRMLENGENIA